MNKFTKRLPATCAELRRLAHEEFESGPRTLHEGAWGAKPRERRQVRLAYRLAAVGDLKKLTNGSLASAESMYHRYRDISIDYNCLATYYLGAAMLGFLHANGTIKRIDFEWEPYGYGAAVLLSQEYVARLQRELGGPVP